MSSWASFHQRYSKLTAELWKETSDSQRRRQQHKSSTDCQEGHAKSFINETNPEIILPSSSRNQDEDDDDLSSCSSTLSPLTPSPNAPLGSSSACNHAALMQTNQSRSNDSRVDCSPALPSRPPVISSLTSTDKECRSLLVSNTTSDNPSSRNSLNRQEEDHHNQVKELFCKSLKTDSLTSRVNNSTSSVEETSTNTSSTTSSSYSPFNRPFFTTGRFSLGKSGIGTRSAISSFLSSLTSSYTASAAPPSPINSSDNSSRNNITDGADPSSSLRRSSETTSSQRSLNHNLQHLSVNPNPFPGTSSGNEERRPSTDESDADPEKTIDILKTADSLNRIMDTQCLSPRPRPRMLDIPKIASGSGFNNNNFSRPNNFATASMGGIGSARRRVNPFNPSDFGPSRGMTTTSPTSGGRFARHGHHNLITNNNGVAMRHHNDNPAAIPSHVSDSVRLSNYFPANNTVTFDGTEYSISESDFDRIEELGSGSSGTVVKMRHRSSGKIVAVKQMRRSGNEDDTKRIANDLDVLLKCCNCDHIVQCYGYMIKETEVWIFMELMSSCFEKLLNKTRAPFPEPILGKVAVATVKALNYLKDNHKVIHRDIKPSNILVNERGVVKLCDFGICGRLVDSKAKTRQAGCTAYLSPERIQPEDPNNPTYDVRADVWSLGITLVELGMGKFPYEGCASDFEVLSKIVQNDPPRLPESDFSREFCDFTKKW